MVFISLTFFSDALYSSSKKLFTLHTSDPSLISPDIASLNGDLLSATQSDMETILTIWLQHLFFGYLLHKENKYSFVKPRLFSPISTAATV